MLGFVVAMRRFLRLFQITVNLVWKLLSKYGCDTNDISKSPLGRHNHAQVDLQPSGSLLTAMMLQIRRHSRSALRLAAPIATLVLHWVSGAVLGPTYAKLAGA